MQKESSKTALLKGLGHQVAQAAEHVPKFFAKAVGDPDHMKALAGYKHQATHSGGPDSLLATPAIWAAEKLLGKGKVDDALWKYVSKPALMADIGAGHVLSKIPLVGKKLFRTTEKLPWGDKLHKDVERASALAPLTKLRDVSEPFIIGYGLEKGLEKVRDFRHTRGQNPMEKDASAEVGMADRQLREKVASAMLHLHSENKGHRKRAHATRLLYRQVEMGLSEMPRSFGEFEEKLATLINQDLVIVEKALELTGGTTKLGEVAARLDSRTLNASEEFQAAILGDEV